MLTQLSAMVDQLGASIQGLRDLIVNLVTGLQEQQQAMKDQTAALVAQTQALREL